MGGNVSSTYADQRSGTERYKDLVYEVSQLQNQVSFITFNENTFFGIPWPGYIERGQRIQQTMIECRELTGTMFKTIGNSIVGNTISSGITTERLVELLSKLKQLKDEIQVLASLEDQNTKVQLVAKERSLALIESTRVICENLLGYHNREKKD